ncbi:MAG: LytR/AlgR family response regulator transcription factor [Chitinophagales bacterium]
MKALLIDDEPLARSVVREYLASFPEIEIAGECNDGFEGVKMIQEANPDLLFLDIQMPKINGFEMLELVDQKPAIIFTTAFDEYAIKAFEANAVDYLLKPFSKDRFDAAVKKFLERKQSAVPLPSTEKLLDDTGQNPPQNSRVVVKTGNKIKIIPVHTIHFLEAADDYVMVMTEEGAFLKNKTMTFFEQNLDGHIFVRTHRSYIVNVQQITRIDPYEKENHIAILKSGRHIPVSKTGYAKLKEVLGV